jgi:Ca-activated chloride channel family protein
MQRVDSRPHSRLPVDGALLAMTALLACVQTPAAQQAAKEVAGITAAGFLSTSSLAATAVVTGGTPAHASSPAPAVTVSTALDRNAVMSGQQGEVRAELVLKARTQPPKMERRPTDLVVILDRSGSMEGDKIVFARRAIGELLTQLGSDDRFALVTYSDDAAVTVPLAYAGDGEVITRWARTVESIPADGYTNMSRGMDLGFDLVERNRVGGRAARVVMISDGLPNLGDSSEEGLLRRAARAPRGEYVMTAVGVGADFNEHLMTKLADAGTGNYHYLADGSNLSRVFADELTTGRSTVASNVEVRVRPMEGVDVLDIAGYPLERTADGSLVFRPGTMFAGQERRVWVTMRVCPSHEGTVSLMRWSASWSADEGRGGAESSEPLAVAAVRDETRYWSSVDKEAWGRAQTTEGWNAVKAKVSESVKAGRKDEAKATLESYRASTADANVHVAAPSVTAHLEAVIQFEAEVDAAFDGDDQAEKQNVLSKKASEEAYKGRRVGQTKD